MITDDRHLYDTVADDRLLSDQIEIIRNDWRNGWLSSPDADAITQRLQHARSYLWLAPVERVRGADSMTPDDILF